MLFIKAHENYSQGALVIPLHQISLGHPFLHVFQGIPFVLSFLQYLEVLAHHGDQEDQHYTSRGLDFLHESVTITLKQLQNQYTKNNAVLFLLCVSSAQTILSHVISPGEDYQSPFTVLSNCTKRTLLPQCKQAV